MKKAGLILSLSLLIVLMAVGTCFAGTLTVTSVYPEDGTKGYQTINFGVTVVFDQDVYTKGTANNHFLSITDANGDKVPLKILYHPEDVGKVLVLCAGDLEQNTEYTFHLAPGFSAVSGDTLEEGMDVTFKTRDASKDNMVNMGMMVAMMVGIIIFSTRAAKKSVNGAKEKKEEKEKVNPYKVSKETGKSINEVVTKDQKRKAKEAAKVAADKERRAKLLAEIIAEERAAGIKRPGVYAVKGPRPISAAGSTFKSGKVEAAEARKREEAARRAAGTTNPKNRKKGPVKKK